MIKKFLFSVLAVVCVSAYASDDSRRAVIRFLSARSAEDPVRYAQAAKNVFEFASKGDSLHMFLLAAVSDEPDFPHQSVPEESVRMYVNYKKRHKQSVEALVSASADADQNALVYYILSLDGNNMVNLRKAANNGCVYALNDLGAMAIAEANAKKGSYKIFMKKMDEGYECFEKAARMADTDATAIYNLGVCQLNGYGCKKDPAAAARNFERAADMNHPKARNALGEMYRDGVEFSQDTSKAIELFSQSALSGNSYGQYNYAMELLKDGGDTGTNAVKAVSLLKKSAMQRNLPAMIEYARCLYCSAGVNTSYTNKLQGVELETARAVLAKEDAERAHQAVSWWFYCADTLKYPPAMYNLAKCFMDGRGVDLNEHAAVAWYRRAADAGYIPAMFAMAECCERGVGGLKKSHYNANWWKTRAHAERGERNARVWLGTHKLQ